MYPQESISPDGESTAPPSDRSDRSSGQLTSERCSGLLQSERSSGHLHSSERDSGIGGMSLGPVTRNRPANGHVADMIIGNQPPLDVDAILRQQQSRQVEAGDGRKSNTSPTESEGSVPSQQVTPSRQLTDTEKLRKVITELIDTERTYVKVCSSQGEG